MMVSVQNPRPDLSEMYITYSRLTNSEHLRESVLRRSPSEISNLFYIIFCKLRVSITNASRTRPMVDHINHVVSVRFPGNVSRVYASKMSVSARVCSVWLVIRRWPIDYFARQSMDRTYKTIETNLSVSVAIRRVRPNQTFVSRKMENNFVEVFQRFAFWCCEHCIRVAVFFPLFIMRVTKSARYAPIIATVNRT